MITHEKEDMLVIWNRKIALTILIIALCVFLCLSIRKIIMLLPLNEPLTKTEVSRAVKDLYPNDDIRRITLLMGGLAGNIGFFFVELESGTYIITPNDKRTAPWIITGNFRNHINKFNKLSAANLVGIKGMPQGTNISLLDYYRYYYYDKQHYPSINNTLMLQLQGIMRYIFKINNKNYVFWAKYGDYTRQ